MPPRECGVLKQWPGFGSKDSTARWTLLRALPIDGADGFAAIIRDGDEVIADAYIAKLDARTGCAELASPKFDSRLSLYGIYRAISRGGTFAVLAQCMQRFGCGRTLFINGVAWPDPAGTPSYETRDIDVAADGKVFVASAEYPESDGGTLEILAERWLSPTAQVLAEGRQRDVPAQVQKVAVVPNGVALAVQTEGPLFYVQFQSNNFENTFTWAPAPGMRVHTLGSHPTFVGVAGGMNPSGLWLGVLHGEFGTSFWTQPRYDLTRYEGPDGLGTFGVEVDDEGAINAVVWTQAGTYLLLDGWENRPATPTPILDTGIPSTFGRMVVPAVSTQSDGTLLWAGELWGRYCAK